MLIDTLSVKMRIIRMAISGELTERPATEPDIKQILKKINEEYLSLLKDGETKKKKEAPMIEEGLFAIPESWGWVPLGQLCILLSRGKSPKYSSEKKYPVFAQKCNQPNGLALEKAKFLDKSTLDNWASYFRLRDQDVVINSTGTGTMGRVGLYTTESLNNGYPFMLPDSHITVARFGTGIIPKYVFYVMRSIPIQAIMERQFRGSTNQKEFYIESVYSIPIPLPSTSEQEEIVSKLDKAIKLLDHIDETQKDYRADFDVLKSKIIDAGIKGELTEQLPEDGTAEELYQQIQFEKAELIKEKKIKKTKLLPEITADEIPFDIPQNWKWVHLDDLAQKISSGNTPAGGKKSNAYVEEGHCFFREQNIYDDGIHEEGMVYITEELLNSRENSTVIAKDILLNITGGSIGRCALIDDDFDRGSINQHILIIRMVDERLRFYIHRLLCSPYAQKYIKFKSVGDKDGFSGGRCKLMPIPLPPLAEQERIAKKIDDLLAAMPE